MRIISLKQAAEMKFSVVHMFSASGYGDAVMFAAVAREIVRQTGKPMLIATRTVNYEMLAGIDVGLPAEICILDAYYAEILNKANVSKLARHGISLNLFSQTKKKAILSEIAVGMGMTGTQNLTPFLHIDESLDNFGKFTEKPQIAIMSGGIYKKIMPTHICQSIVDKYRDKCDFVLIGMKDDPAISNTVDMRGKLKFPSEVLAV
ncbi:MAG: hypothetical protein FWE17_02315, partial [Alphaproteobacteria bacterium]|nr:hypothetical protein [Alphaproteobacteria bacterium]